MAGLTFVLTISLAAFAVKAVDIKTFCKDHNLRDGTYPDTTNCAKYIECKGGETYQSNCPTGQNFNTPTLKCAITSVVDCSLNFNYNFNSFIGPDAADYTDYCKRFNLADGLYADPFDCGHFIECSNGITSHMACPHGLAFNINLKVCDDAHNADCNFNMDDSNICFANRWENGIHPYPNDCSKFIECTYYKTDVMPCPPDLVYDAIIQTCVRGQNDHHCDTSGYYSRSTTRRTTTTTTTTTTTPTTTTTTTTTTTRKPINYQTFCKENNMADGNYPDPFDCSKYIECRGGETYRIDCDDDKNFNTKNMMCDAAANVDCSLNYYYNFGF